MSGISDASSAFFAEVVYMTGDPVSLTRCDTIMPRAHLVYVAGGEKEGNGEREKKRVLFLEFSERGNSATEGYR